MKLMLATDTHLSDRPPSVRTESYAEDILQKLRFMAIQAAENECEAIVLAGDVFHIKAPSRTSHRLVQLTHEALTSSGLPVLIVPGNHDMSHDRLDSLDSQPLGSLARMEGIELLLGWHEKWNLFGLPWVASPAELSSWMMKWKDKDRIQCHWNLMVTHASIFPAGVSQPYDFIPSTEWAEMMHMGACFFGHIHDSYGVWHEMADGPVVFCNHGALSRGSLHESTLKRVPAITLYDDDEHAFPETIFRRIDVPHGPASEVFRLVEVEERKEAKGRLDEFLAEVGSSQLTVSGAEEVLQAVEQMELEPQTRKAVVECVEDAASR